MVAVVATAAAMRKWEKWERWESVTVLGSVNAESGRTGTRANMCKQEQTNKAYTELTSSIGGGHLDFLNCSTHLNFIVAKSSPPSVYDIF